MCHSNRPSSIPSCLEQFNDEWSQQTLPIKCPAQVQYAFRPCRGHSEPYYPSHDRTVVFTNCGRLCLYRKKISLNVCPARQAVGIKEVDNRVWLVRFTDYDLGYVDLDEKPLQPLANPFGPKALPMS